MTEIRGEIMFLGTQMNSAVEVRSIHMYITSLLRRIAVQLISHDQFQS